MRSPKSRSRSKSNNRNRSVGNIVNRVFESSGPEGKVRGTPQQIIEKYNQLARDAQLSNDRVALENFQQHAEHYTRMLGEAQREQEVQRERQEAQQAQQNNNRNQGDGGQGGDRNQGNSHNNGGQNSQNNGGHQGHQNAQGNDQNNDQSGRDDAGNAPQNERRRRTEPRRNKPAPASDPGAGEQPDVIDLGPDAQSGLVETPEEGARPAPEAPAPKPRKPRAPRRKKFEDQTGAAQETPNPEAPEAAE
ncbi:MAG: DUF4167 domain-containing protein [Paracoccaceae bacterium]